MMTDDMMPEDMGLGEEQSPAPEDESWKKEYIGTMELYSDDFYKSVMDKASVWKQCVEGNGLYRQARENFRLYLNADPVGADFQERSFALTGENGEFLKVRFNQFRKWLTYILNMATAQKLAMQAKAANSDEGSLTAAQLFDGVLHYFTEHWKRGRASKQLRKAKELSLFTPISYVLVEWDYAAGAPWVPMPGGQMMTTGDLYVKCRSFWDVWFDTNAEDEDELSWVIVRDYYNRYDLVARFPDKKEQILGLESKNQLDDGQFWGWNDDTDLVPVYKFYHKSTQACPKGRCAWLVEGDTVLLDGENPYIDDLQQAIIPLLMMKASEGLGTVFGYAPGNDLAPVQMGYNMTASGVMTTEAAFGIPNLSYERGSDVSPQSVAGGMNAIERNPGSAAPELLKLDGHNEGSLEVLALLRNEGEQAAGLNGAVTGNNDVLSKAASGRVLGLMQSQSVQYQSGFNGNAQQLDQDFANLVLLICKQFAKAEQITQIIGKDKVVQMAKWTGATFSEVARVVAEAVNPIARTTAGAREEAEFMVQNGMISTPQEYLMVRNTGQLEPLFRADQGQLNLIAEENSNLMEGKNANPETGTVTVLATDRHEWHIPEHLALLDSPAIRMNGERVAYILAHVQQHQQFAAQMAPQPVEQMPDGQPQGQGGAQKQAEPSTQQQAAGPSGPVPVPDTATVTQNMTPGM